MITLLDTYITDLRKLFSVECALILPMFPFGNGLTGATICSILDAIFLSVQPKITGIVH